MSFSSSHATDLTVLLLCQEPPWRSSIRFAWDARILPFPILHPPHTCLWCRVSWCLITKRRAPCLPHLLSPSPSSTTPKGNWGTATLPWILASHSSIVSTHLNFDGFVHLFSYSLVWTVAQDSAFSVSPSSCDLAPLKSTSFRVTYDPKQLNTLHGAQLECFGYYKMVYINYSKVSII